MDNVPDVVEDPPTLRDGMDDRRVVVICQNQRRGLFGDICARAHPDSNVGGAQRLGIVDPIPSHGNSGPLPSPSLDDLHLVHRIYSGERPLIANGLGEVLQTQAPQLGSVHHLPVVESHRVGHG